MTKKHDPADVAKSVRGARKAFKERPSYDSAANLFVAQKKHAEAVRASVKLVKQ